MGGGKTLFLTATGGQGKELGGQCPPPKIKKEKTVRLSYNSEKNVNCDVPAFFARHPGARDSIISHFVDLSLVRKR